MITHTATAYPDRDWRIRVLQLPCDQDMAGCLQYHTGPTGVDIRYLDIYKYIYMLYMLFRFDHQLQLLEH